MCPGLVAAALGLLGLTPPLFHAYSVVVLVAFCVAMMVLAPIVLSLGLMSMYGASAVTGRTVHLRIDDRGVHGWPIASDMDRTWSRIRRVHSLRVVVALPFRQLGTRAGWVPVPERALTPEQLVAFRELLKSKGVM